MKSLFSAVTDRAGTAEAHPELIFLVTEIGCGIAGYTVTQIAPFFSAALDLPNVLLPQRFVEYLQQANE